MKPITRCQIFTKEKKGGETSFYIDSGAKFNFTPLFSCFVVNAKCVKAVLAIYHSLSPFKLVFSSPSSCFLTFLLLLAFQQPFSYNHGFENNITLRKTTHKNIVESVKGFRFATNVKRKKVGG